jgi:multicomponent Na+:H+ antiporter subunit F
MTTVFLVITMCFLIMGIIITLIRMLKGPTSWDRLMALNLISSKIIMLLTIFGIYSSSIILLDISIAYSIIGFLGIVLLCKFIAQGGRLK